MRWKQNHGNRNEIHENRTATCTCLDYKRNVDIIKELNSQANMELINYGGKWKSHVEMPCSRMQFQILCNLVIY
jgi:hypothetical protein